MLKRAKLCHHAIFRDTLNGFSCAGMLTVSEQINIDVATSHIIVITNRQAAGFQYVESCDQDSGNL